jgi:DNA-binding Xre family transcriptional regulator
MIRLKLNEVLEKRGLTAYALHVKSKKDGKFRLHQSVISKIKHNKSKALQIEILDLLCELLECQPADLIVYESATQPVSTTQNVKRATQNVKHTQTAIATQSETTTQSETGFVSVADVMQRLGKSETRVLDYLRKGRLKGKKPGRTWIILESDLLEFQSSEWFQNL